MFTALSPEDHRGMLTLIGRRAPEPTPAELFRHPCLAGPAPLMAVGRTGIIEQTNSAAAEMLGYGEIELIGLHLSEITAWDSRRSDPFAHGDLTTWLHARGHTVRTRVSRMEQIWADEPYFLVGLTPVGSVAA